MLNERWHGQWVTFIGLLVLCVIVGCLFKTVNQYFYWALCTAGCVTSSIMGIVYHRIARSESNSVRDIYKPAPQLQVVYALLTLSAMLFVAPPIFRIASSAPVNDGVHPAVCRPGQLVKIYVPPSIRSLTGKWGGDAEVTWVNNKKFNASSQVLVALPSHKDYQLVYDKTASLVPYVEVAIPNRQDLVGKSMDLNVNLHISYPVADDSHTFHYETQRSSRELTLQVGSRQQSNLDQVIAQICFPLALALPILVAFYKICLGVGFESKL